jgi:hypothetical protein
VLFLAAVGELDHQAVLALFEDSRDGGQGQDADRQDLPANQRVDQARFAALELADHRDLEPQSFQATGRLGGQVGDLGHAQQLGRLCQPNQHPSQVDRAGGLDTCLHLHLPVRDGTCRAGAISRKAVTASSIAGSSQPQP